MFLIILDFYFEVVFTLSTFFICECLHDVQNRQLLFFFWVFFQELNDRSVAQEVRSINGFFQEFIVFIFKS